MNNKFGCALWNVCIFACTVWGGVKDFSETEWITQIQIYLSLRFLIILLFLWQLVSHNLY